MHCRTPQTRVVAKRGRAAGAEERNTPFASIMVPLIRTVPRRQHPNRVEEDELLHGLVLVVPGSQVPLS